MPGPSILPFLKVTDDRQVEQIADFVESRGDTSTSSSLSRLSGMEAISGSPWFAHPEGLGVDFPK
jgi:hypothetical protein